MHKPKKLRKLIKSAKSGDPYAMYKLGLYYQTGKYTASDMESAAFWIERSALLGNKEAEEWIKDYCYDDNAMIQSLE